MSARATRGRLALALALLGAVVLAVLSGYRAWRRAARPLLRVSLAKPVRLAHLVASGRVLAVGEDLDRLLDVDREHRWHQPHWLWHLTALDSGEDLGSREIPASDTLVGWAPRSGKALLRTAGGALVALDLLTGVRGTLLQQCESATVALSLAEDLVASVTTGAEVALESVAPGTSASRSVLPGSFGRWDWTPVFSPAGDRVAAYTGDDGELTVWSTHDRLPVAHGSGVPLGFTGDGGVLSRSLATRTHLFLDATLHVLGPGSEDRYLGSCHLDENWAVSSNGACVAGVAGSLEAPAVVVLSTATGAALRRLARATSTRSLDLSPEGDLLVVLDDTAAEVWEVPPP